jgi:uncharacterized paraquat-inducible protein A
VADLPGGWQIAAAFVLVAAPAYVVARVLVKLAREAYGCAPGSEPDDQLRVCQACHSTVLETEYSHCPYCGAELGPLPGAAEAPSGDVS